MSISVKLVRTTAKNKHFIALVRLLDADIAIRYVEDHLFYDQFNTIENIKCVVLAYVGDEAIACGSVKVYDDQTMEIKRMFTLPEYRAKGISTLILKELEQWTVDLGCTRCILETGIRQPEAIRLYEKNGYSLIPNFDQYVGVTDSRCFEKRFV